jgi:hypothetical protein
MLPIRAAAAEETPHETSGLRQRLIKEAGLPMKTIALSKKDMEARIARFRALKPLPIQNASIPQKARDVVYSRKLLCVVGLEKSTPINAEAPIRGAAGMTMTLAVCPPGQGPGLHAHRQTYETFTVLTTGQF